MFTLAVAALAFATPIIVSKLWRQLEKPGAIFDFGYLDQWHVVGQQVGPASTTVVRDFQSWLGMSVRTRS